MQWTNIETSTESPKPATVNGVIVSDAGKRAIERALSIDATLAALILVAILEAESQGYALGKKHGKMTAV